jgi:hypothetical protein
VLVRSTYRPSALQVSSGTKCTTRSGYNENPNFLRACAFIKRLAEIEQNLVAKGIKAFRDIQN